nr:MAG TPA: hypothetical protein [Caudoviricetes sp.]
MSDSSFIEDNKFTNEFVFTSKKYRHLVYFNSLLLELFTVYLYYWFNSFRCLCSL